LPDLI